MHHTPSTASRISHRRTLWLSASVLIAASALLLGEKAHSEVYAKESMIKAQQEKAGGGQGVLVGEYAFTRDKAKKLPLIPI